MGTEIRREAIELTARAVRGERIVAIARIDGSRQKVRLVVERDYYDRQSAAYAQFFTEERGWVPLTRFAFSEIEAFERSAAYWRTHEVGGEVTFRRDLDRMQAEAEEVLR